MKRHELKSASSRRRPANRPGSTLIIVVALMGMMAFLGFVFYTFATQERANAIALAESVKVKTVPSIEADSLMDFAMQQLIVGPNDSNCQSVLWGGRHSLMANMYGRDGIPFNGEGVRLNSTTAGQPFVDMDEDGTATLQNVQFGGSAMAEDFFLLNAADSAAVNGSNWSSTNWGNGKNFYSGSVAFNPTTQYLPAPDVDYTAPDINNFFLSYDGIAVNSSGLQTRVIIPSFLRPQYLRTPASNGSGTIVFASTHTTSPGPVAAGNWYNSTQAICSQGGSATPFSQATTNLQIMRPHPNHVCVDTSGNVLFFAGSTTPIPRYTSINFDNAAGTGSTYSALGMRRPFDANTTNPFCPPESTDPATNTSTPGSLGVWSPNTMVNAFDIDLDVDTDGDGIMDAILMDLGYPPTRRGDGKWVVPLFAVSIRDLNGLLNLNATGNLSGNLNLVSPVTGLPALNASNQLGFRANGLAATNFYAADNLSKSNLGMSTFEINPQRATTADPTISSSSNYNDPQLGTSETAWQLSCFLNQFDSTVNLSSSPAVTPAARGRPGRSVAELANMEWLNLNIGRAQFHLGQVSSSGTTQYAMTDLFPGRSGEYLNLRHYLATWSSNGGGLLNTTQFMPRAGLSVTNFMSYPTQYSTGAYPADDNNNFDEGETQTYSPTDKTNWVYNATPWVQPADFLGSGKQFHRMGLGPDGQPGMAGYDDDGDGIIDNASEAGWPPNGGANSSDDPQVFTPQSTSNAVVGPTMTYNSKYTDPNPNVTPLTYPNQTLWPAFSGYHTYGTVQWGASTSLSQFNSYTSIDGAAQSYGPNLMRNPVGYSLLDDPTEAVIDPILMSPSYSGSQAAGNVESSSVRTSVGNDSVFGPQENLFLQGSGADDRLTQARSRLADLMPANLVASVNAPDIRKRLTTSSTDRREFGLTSHPVGQLRTEGVVATPGYNQWATTYPNPHNYYPFITSTSAASPTASYLPWESSPQFPPDMSIQLGLTANPYRPELFYFLLQAASNTSLLKPGVNANNVNWINPATSLKMNVNRFLYLNSAGTQFGFAPLPPQNTPGDTTNDVAAAVVRQNMARDIYTLLYTLCHVHSTVGNPTIGDVDYRTAAAPTVAQTREMAQFAVNLVDAMDPDNIITAFWYDPDLSSTTGNGWDKIYGVDGIQGTADDTVVYGVERQLLAITEAMGFSVAQTATNSQATIFDDTKTPTTGRQYLYFELENVTPLNVTIASNGVVSGNATKYGDWRVRLQYPAATATSAGTDLAFLYLLPGLVQSNTNYTNAASNYIYTDSNANDYLQAGQLFTVSSQDGTDQFSTTTSGTYRPSDFRISSNNSGGNYTLAIPSSNYYYTTTYNTAGGTHNVDSSYTGSTTITGSLPGNQFPTPKCNLDLVWDGYYAGNTFPTGGSTLFYIADASGGSTINATPGAFAKALENSGIPSGGTFGLVLERRAGNGQQTGTLATWVAVDSTTVTNQQYTPPTTGTSANFASASTFRNTPLNRNNVSASASGSSSFNLTPKPYNPGSSGGIATPSSTPPNAYQWQPDRDFVSLGELMMVPLYGPGDAVFNSVTYPGLTTIGLSNSEFYQYTNSSGSKYYPAVAAARFLRPDNPDYVLNGGTTNGNRWYRLFDFLEVQNRQHRHPAVGGITTTSVVSFGTPTTNPAIGTPVTFTNGGTIGTTAIASPSFPTSPLTGNDSFPLAEPFNLPQFYGWPRTHGLINLNMIRYPQVLLGLIDDDTVVNDPRFYNSTGGTSYIDSRYYNGYATTNLDATDESTATAGVQSRQWWVQFLAARDSRMGMNNSGFAYSPDPVTGEYLPGTAASRPFRGFDSVGVAAKSIVDSPLENTILRGLPLDPISTAATTNPNVSRRLFEIGTQHEHTGNITLEATDATNLATLNNTTATVASPTVLPPAVRYQILSKLMNNTTTRSNTFAVYVTAQYYEAASIPATNVNGASLTAFRIGGQLTDTPVQRAFFVVDRTNAVEQMKILSSNLQNGSITVSNPATFPVSGSTYSFVPNTDTTNVRTNMNGIRWKDLVLYRQNLN